MNYISEIEKQDNPKQQLDENVDNYLAKIYEPNLRKLLNRFRKALYMY